MPRAVTGDKFRYHNTEVMGYGQQMTGGSQSPDMADLDIQDGMEVMFLDFDADSGWPIVEWTDTTGLGRITTIDPILFDTQFIPA